MALPLPSGLTPPEIAFLCEMELVTVVPRQRLEALHLLGGPLPPLQPPNRAPLPLWLALLLKRQRRANILPPLWLNPHSLTHILELETSSPSFSPAPSLPPPSPFPLSPPFLPTSTSSAHYDDSTSTIGLPYHYLELSSLLLDVAADDIPDQDAVRRLLRDLREVRMAKIRGGVSVLEGGREVRMDGVGGLEVAEARAFVGGVVDGLRRIGASKEQVRREREAEEREMGAGEGEGEGEQEDGMDY